MSQTSRMAKEERQLRLLEEEFRVKLVSALKDCAAGMWGLFGQNEDTVGRELYERWYGSQGRELLELGEEIVAKRQAVGEPADFPLFTRFREYRAMRGANDPGERKLARRFLGELGYTDV